MLAGDALACFGQVTALYIVADQIQGARIIGERRRDVAEAVMQVGPHGPDAVPVTQRRIAGQLVKERERVGRAGRHGDGHGPVERHDRRVLDGLQLVVKHQNAGPVGAGERRRRRVTASQLGLQQQRPTLTVTCPGQSAGAVVDELAIPLAAVLRVQGKQYPICTGPGVPAA